MEKKKLSVLWIRISLSLHSHRILLCVLFPLFQEPPCIDGFTLSVYYHTGGRESWLNFEDALFGFESLFSNPQYTKLLHAGTNKILIDY